MVDLEKEKEIEMACVDTVQLQYSTVTIINDAFSLKRWKKKKDLLTCLRECVCVD